MREAVASNGLDWFIHHIGPRAGYTFAPEAPRNAAEAWAIDDHLIRRVLRIWMANRGVWEAIVGAGPVVPVPGSTGDVDLYHEHFATALEAIASCRV
jgi:glutamate-1-semialdehyde 2,1-aminomutase